MFKASAHGVWALVMTLILARELPVRQVGCRVLAIADDQVVFKCPRGHGFKVDDRLDLDPVPLKRAGN